MNTAWFILIAVLVLAAFFYVIRLRKRYSLQAIGVMQEAVARGSWNLAIHVSNTGRRPIYLSFVTIKKPDKSTFRIPFGDTKPVPLDVGDSLEREIRGHSGEGFWETEDELTKSKIFIEDVREKSYRAKVQSRTDVD